MERVLVTGGAGFIGSHVADALVRSGRTVTVLDDLSGGLPDNVPAGAGFVQGSITDRRARRSDCSPAARFDCVFHLAAYAAEGLSHFIKRFNYTNNVIGSVNLINAAVNNGVKGFVFTSSIAVYGSSPVLPMTEDTRPGAGGSLRHRQVRGRAGARREPRDVRPRLHRSSGRTTSTGRARTSAIATATSSASS